MNAGAKLIVLMLAAAPLVCVAEDDKAKEQAAVSCITGITYSLEFVEKYPNAGAACQEVTVKDGQKWVRFEAEVEKVKGNQVTANFLGTHKETLRVVTFEATPDARVNVGGKPKEFKSLSRGDILSFWMPESRLGFYAAPGSAETQKLKVVSNEPPKK